MAALLLANASPTKRRVRAVAEEAVEAEDGMRSVDEVAGTMATVPATLYLAINVALFAAIIGDMVLKPF